MCPVDWLSLGFLSRVSGLITVIGSFFSLKYLALNPYLLISSTESVISNGYAHHRYSYPATKIHTSLCPSLPLGYGSSDRDLPSSLSKVTPWLIDFFSPINCEWLAVACLSSSLGTEEDLPQHLAPHTSCNPKALEDVRATRWKERGFLSHGLLF